MKPLITLLVIALFSSTVYATNGTRMVGFNSKTIGRGGTAIGLFDSPSLMMTNPGGLSFLNGSSLDVNFSLMVPILHFTNGLNDADGKTNYFPLPGFAYVNHEEGSPLTWGVGAFTQGGMGSDFSLSHALFGTTKQEYHSKLAVMQGGLSGAYKVSEQFSVGASLHLVYSMLDFKMPYSLSPSTMKGVVNPANGMTFGDMFAGPPAAGGFGYTEVTAFAEMKNLSAFGFSGKLGLAYKVNENLTLGASYTSPSALTYKSGKANMDMTAQLNNAFGLAVQGYMLQNPSATPQQAQAAIMAQFAGLGIDLSKGVVAQYELETKLTFPQSVGFGVGFRMSADVRLAIDVEWVNWKKAFDKMALSLSNGSNSNINRMLGNSGSLSLDFPMNWKDEVCFRVGGEYATSTSLTLRAGYAYGSNPVPETTVFPVFPAIVENHLMLGASYKVSDPISLHLAYEMALNKQQTASSQSMIAREYNNSTSQLSESIFHFSMSWDL